MRFKSLRTHVALLVGLCILAVVAVLVGYATLAASRSQALVTERTGELLEANAEQRLRALADARTQEISRQAGAGGGPGPGRHQRPDGEK